MAYMTEGECSNLRESCVKLQTEKLGSVKARLALILAALFVLCATAAFGWMTRAESSDVRAIETRVQVLEKIAESNRTRLDGIERNTERILDKLNGKP